MGKLSGVFYAYSLRRLRHCIPRLHVIGRIHSSTRRRCRPGRPPTSSDQLVVVAQERSLLDVRLHVARTDVALQQPPAGFRHGREAGRCTAAVCLGAVLLPAGGSRGSGRCTCLQWLINPCRLFMTEGLLMTFGTSEGVLADVVGSSLSKVWQGAGGACMEKSSSLLDRSGGSLPPGPISSQMCSCPCRLSSSPSSSELGPCRHGQYAVCL